MKDIRYRSTRSELEVSASQAILQGLSEDGGLFIPTSIPALTETPEELAGMSYKELAYAVMSKFLTDFTSEELWACIDGAYDGKFDTPLIAPLREADGAWYLELFHGSTIAFKDMALSILPYLMTTAARKNGTDRKIVILTATSGDTGKAAMAGFADVPGTEIIVFYPKDGVSRIQERQMVTQRGDNTHVVAIKGNFDDAQTAVKRMFNDREMNERINKAGFQFSSANSINIGRLVPQIVYYVYAYAQMVKHGAIGEGECINITVPTGNFGNILAAYYAKLMGLPVRKLLCASNENKVLCDFFETGAYDRRREFILTSSPSMDILISSNLERLICRLCENDPVRCAAFMKELSEKGEYRITEEMRSRLSDFRGGFATEEENFAGIRELFEKTGYVIDTHTGIANAVWRRYAAETGDATKTVIASTASPYKFAVSVVGAIDPERVKDRDDFAVIDELRKLSGVPEPQAITDIRTAPVRHTRVSEVADMPAVVLDILHIS